ncbi:hypothetical protein Pcinc_015500 [Petrolisthes cinctipes]|uniref:C-type lectin domain-containing protein n=1 Tax=Petrolisthes cinctipes TaxID=88211 RepID=A0AAE1FSW1_PETCI|nr:hypothetical protein Pcinc_015500 [Petrolisthes cinctipes]
MRWHLSRTTHNPLSFLLMLLVVVFLSCGVKETRAEDTTSDQDICAMTEVLTAMKELLVMLSSEIRDLRKQVGVNCMSVNATTPPTSDDSTTTSCEASTKTNDGQGTDDGDDEAADEDIHDKIKDMMTTMATLTGNPEEDGEHDDFDLDLNFGIEEEGIEYDGNVTNPFVDVADAVGDWWQGFSLFQPEPSPEVETEAEDEDGGNEDVDGPDTEDLGRTDTHGPGDEVALPELEPEPLPLPLPRSTTTTTTTTTTAPSYALPPVPTGCPEPFRLMAESCYLIWNSHRDWRTWGEADGVCQKYGGRLAAPWRLRPLQEFLSRHYSDAFWIGAQFDTYSRSWKWLSGRPVEEHEWKAGQPNRHPGKRCMFLNKGFGYQGVNFFCGEKYPFICEYQAV